MGKRKIPYSLIILHWRDLQRQLDKITYKQEEARKWKIITKPLKNINIGNIHYETEDHEITTYFDNDINFEKLHKFINELGVDQYDAWQAHCRKAKARTNEKAIGIDNEQIHKIIKYLNRHHNKQYQYDKFGKKQLNEALNTLLSDALKKRVKAKTAKRRSP